MGDRQLYLIDATAFCYRAFYALRGLATSFGQPTNAIYGFLNILNKILKERKPEYLAVCFDISRDTFRQRKFAEYKINRPPMPDGLVSQIPLIKEIIRAFGIAIFEKEGYEADDIIATIASAAKKKGCSVVIVSSDKDILQLVDDKTTVFSPYKDEGVFYNEGKVFERYGIKPERITEVIALMGDGVDNIPSVPGIGEKSAVGLLKDFGSLQDLLRNLNKVKQDKLRESLKGHIEQIRLNLELAELKKDVEIDFSLDKARIGSPDYRELFRLFKHLEFKRLLKELPVQEEEAGDFRLQEVQDKELLNLVNAEEELVLCGDSSDNLVFHAKDMFFRVKGAGRNMKNILSDYRIKKVGYDLKKTKVSLNKNNMDFKGLSFDVMIAAYLLNPSKPGYSLADICLDYLGTPPAEKNTQGPKAAALIAQLKPKLEKELQEKSLSALFKDLEMPLVEVLSDMELNGIKIDAQALKKLSHELEKRLIKLIEDIYGLSGCQFNINSPKQLREILFEKLKLPVVKRSKTGPSTDEEVLRALAPRHKLPEMLLEYRQLTKLKNTYIDILPDLVDKETGRIHTSFNQTGTETGRLSSSNPNLQNVPVKTDIGRKIRQAIVSSGKDYCLLSCDYSQIELRILAHLSRDKNLIVAFMKDKDVHRATAALIFGIDENDITEKMRDVAKRVNFGIIYGLTSYGLSRDLGISVDEAQRFIDAYFARYPKVADYIQEQIEKAQREGFVTTMLGRRRYLSEINNKNQGIRQFAQRQAINTPIQGSASDLIKLAMVDIHSKIKEKNLKSRMILQIHDELLFDAPKNELVELTALVKDRMENVLKLDVPIRVDIKKGQNWLDMEGEK